MLLAKCIYWADVAAVTALIAADQKLLAIGLILISCAPVFCLVKRMAQRVGALNALRCADLHPVAADRSRSADRAYEDRLLAQR